MKFGSFLLGGLVGAAAVVYFSKNSMFFSALSSSQSAGKMMDKAKDRMTKATGKVTASDTFTASKTESKSAADHSVHKDAAVGGLGKVQEIINQDPELKVTVQEILSHNQAKETVHTQ
ncbi:hypothetical protein [Paenibacillus piri]|uniref:Uncharacterized protein n=1 Tax=Paenibacillus piri TaxID=2547395 RepID=A0A4R5KWC0_9BACL|nr:hypothetical protein [Paenibacillus piri]TDF99317.1 hypothetical protein E1757_05500 [Paenibacillus piri]